MKTPRFPLMFLPTLLLLASCDPGADPVKPTSLQEGCHEGTAGEVTVFSDEFKQGTEGIAFSDDGRLFVSARSSTDPTEDAIYELASDGTRTRFATVPSAVGLAWRHDSLMVASGSDGSGQGGKPFCTAGNAGAVYAVSREGVVTLFTKDSIPQPNFVAVTPWDTMLVSDDCPDNKKIYEVDNLGAVSVWGEPTLSPNGMAFDKQTSSLFIATTFVAKPPLVKVTVGERKPVTSETVRDFADGTSPDGIAIDEDGDVYVALNTAHQVARVAADGSVTRVNADDENTLFVASLAFGSGKNGFDACSIYATSLYSENIYKVYVGKRGLPLLTGK